VRKFPPKKSAPALTSVPTKGKGVAKPLVKATKPLVKRSLSIADKENLKKSNISHLPPDKQMEYKKLLVLLAQKEKAKKTKNANNIKALTVSITKDSELRTVKQNQPPKPARFMVTSTPQKMVPISKPTEKKLKEKEADLISSRKSMSASLFKLSAEVSQLKEETSKKETAEAFLEKLQSQVAVTIELITKKNERINKLKTVVRQSHQDVVTKSQSMSILRKECKSMGTTLKGKNYQTPQEGMDLIRKKLSVIQSSAKKVATNQNETNNVVNVEAPNATSTPDTVKPVVETVPDSSEESSSSSSDSEDTGSDVSDSSSSESSSDNEGNIEQKSSSLAHLAKPSVVLDPQVELCRFDLQGRCNDKTCPYQHLSRPSTPPPTPQ